MLWDDVGYPGRGGGELPRSGKRGNWKGKTVPLMNADDTDRKGKARRGQIDGSLGERGMGWDEGGDRGRGVGQQIRYRSDGCLTEQTGHIADAARTTQAEGRKKSGN